MADGQNGKSDDGAQSKYAPFDVANGPPKEALDEQPKQRSALFRVCPFILGEAPSTLDCPRLRGRQEPPWISIGQRMQACAPFHEAGAEQDIVSK